MSSSRRDGEWIGDWLEESATAPDGDGASELTARDARPARVDVLEAVPEPRTIYLGALARASRAIVSSQPVVTTLPDVALRADGIALDRERLDTYCHLVGERALDVAPPGFVHVSVFGMQLALLARPDFPLPMLGMVHVANRIEQLRPARLSETFTATTWARRLASRPVAETMGTQVELVTEVRSGSELVWQGVSTYLARSTQIGGLPVLERPEHPAFTPPTPTGGWNTTQRLSKDYAAVSGDRNPIHTSRLAARGLGYRATIAHGMDTAARALAALGPARGDAFTWSVEFAAPVLVPGRVAVSVERRDDVDGAEATAGDAGDSTRSGFALTVWDPKRGKLHLASTLAHA